MVLPEMKIMSEDMLMATAANTADEKSYCCK